MSEKLKPCPLREILFRGKRVDNGTWAYGDLSYWDDEMEIDSESHGENGGFIIPETVGQYTGLTDKNGKKIFEGDIVKYTEIDIDGSDDKYIGVIYYNQSKANYVIKRRKYMVNFVTSWIGDVEVIGNIYDNQELLEVEEHE